MAIAAKNIDSLKKQTLYLAIGSLVVSAAMTATAGWAFGADGGVESFKWAAFMVMITIGACILPNFITLAFNAGRTLIAVLFLLVAGGCMVAEFSGHLMVVAGHRRGEAQTEMIQNTRYDDIRANVGALQKQLAEAEEKFKVQAPYGTPDSYEDRIKTAQAKIELEGSRGGCKDRCLALKTELAKLTEGRAIARDRVTVTEPEIKRLTAALAEARAESAKTPKGHSLAVNQTDVIARIMSVNLNPDGTTKGFAELWLGVFLALVATLFPAATFFAAQQDWTPVPKPTGPSLFARIRAWWTGQALAETPKPETIVKREPPKLVLLDPRSAAQHLRGLGQCA